MWAREDAKTRRRNTSKRTIYGISGRGGGWWGSCSPVEWMRQVTVAEGLSALGMHATIRNIQPMLAPEFPLDDGFLSEANLGGRFKCDKTGISNAL
jgi:hypothetical protein